MNQGGGGDGGGGGSGGRGEASPEAILDFYILEESPPRSHVGSVVTDYGLDRKYTAAVLTTLRFRMLTYSGPAAGSAGASRLFSLDEETGSVATTEVIDRDRLCPRADVCRVTFDVIVQPTRHFEIVKVHVDIIDVNDNSPVFPSQPGGVVSVELDETAEPGAGFSVPPADDLDSPRNGVRRYALLGAPPQFEINVRNRSDGVPVVRVTLKDRLKDDHQQHHHHYPLQRHPTTAVAGGMVSTSPAAAAETRLHSFRVVAVDGGDPARSGSVLVNVTVVDVNDHTPVFENVSYEARVRENAAPGTVVFRVTARDADPGLNGRLAYRFTDETRSRYGDEFAVGPESGKIYTRATLDAETRAVYTLYVTASDRAGAVGDSLSAMTSVIVRVDDVNDHAPEIRINTRGAAGGDRSGGDAIIDSTSSTFGGLVSDGGGGWRQQQQQLSEISAAVEEGVAADTFIAHVTVRDGDSGNNGRFRCVLADTNRFALRQHYTTEYVIVTADALLDRESRDRYHVTVYCADDGSPQMRSEASVTVTVTDRNDNPPVFLAERYEARVSEDAPIGTRILQVSYIRVLIGVLLTGNQHVIYR